MSSVSLKCSECGKEFTVVNNRGYSYKIKFDSYTRSRKNKFPADSIYGCSSYQCCYTCNDHALLRVNKQGHMTKENFIQYVKKSEDTMRSRGLVVRYPIDISKVK